MNESQTPETDAAYLARLTHATKRPETGDTMALIEHAASAPPGPWTVARDMERQRNALREQLNTRPASAEGSGEVEELRREVAALRRSCDPFNGDTPTRCGCCFAPMTAVRPGKHQCDFCEERDSMADELATLTRQLAEEKGRLDWVLEYGWKLVLNDESAVYLDGFDSKNLQTGRKFLDATIDAARAQDGEKEGK